MNRRTAKFLKAALSALYYSGAGRLARRITGGNGVIFMLHHVTPEAPRAFDPNGILKVTPGFLETVICDVQASGFDCISLDDVPERLRMPQRRPFAVFTLDDGYRDNRDHAYPVFKRHAVPFTIYVPTSFADGTGDMWWLNLEAAIGAAEDLSLDMDGARRSFDVRTPEGKGDAYRQLYWWMRRIPEDRARAVARRLAREAGVDVTDLCRDLVMTWGEIRALAADPLVTIGAHTSNHFALAKLPYDKARAEIADNIARIEAETGLPCRHLSYPYGGPDSAGPREFEMARELGLATAVTTRKGLITGRNKDAVTALPRLSLNGDFQERRYVQALLSGVPFTLWNAFERLAPVRAAGLSA